MTYCYLRRLEILRLFAGNSGSGDARVSLVEGELSMAMIAVSVSEVAKGFAR